MISYDGMGMDHEWVIDPERVHQHVGHDIEIVTYAGRNLAIECMTCGMVLADIDYWTSPEEYPDDTVRQNGPIVIGERCPWCGAMVTEAEHSRSHD